MIDFNATLLFYIGSALRELSGVKAGVRVIDVIPALTEARNGIQVLISSDHYKRVLPQMGKKAQDVLGLIDALLPETGINTRDRIISKSEADFLEIELNVFVSTIMDSCKEAFVVALERQRAFDLHTLIDSIETAFDANVWRRLSPFSKREIEESGKCLAFERYTASGFHMLRAIEFESRDCAILVSGAMPKRRDFGDYITILKDNGADARMIASLDNVRSLERNPLVHPEDWLSQDDAVNIFYIGQVVFSRLISWVENKNLFP